METIIKDNLKFYHIRSGQSLYRGNTDQYNDARDLSSQSEYFALDERTANIYGLVKEYNVNTDILLYAMDDINNIKQLYNGSPYEIQRRITSAFGYAPTNENIFRQSDETSDVMISNHICSIGLDGYCAMELETDELIRKFHAEIVLCNPKDKVLFVEKMQYSDKQLQDATLKQLEKNQRRFRTQHFNKTKTISKRRAFDDEDDEDNDIADFKPKKLTFINLD